jgi:hypothetical protein
MLDGNDPWRLGRHPNEVRIANASDYHGDNAVGGNTGQEAIRGETAIRTRSVRRRVERYYSRTNRFEQEYKFRPLNSGVSPEQPKKRTWLKKLIFGKLHVVEPKYDDSIHELHATTRELERNVSDLEQVIQPFLDARNPMIAMVIALLNEQQMRPPEVGKNDVEPNS